MLYTFGTHSELKEQLAAKYAQKIEGVLFLHYRKSETTPIRGVTVFLYDFQSPEQVLHESRITEDVQTGLLTCIFPPTFSSFTTVRKQRLVIDKYPRTPVLQQNIFLAYTRDSFLLEAIIGENGQGYNIAKKDSVTPVIEAKRAQKVEGKKEPVTTTQYAVQRKKITKSRKKENTPLKETPFKYVKSLNEIIQPQKDNSLSTEQPYTIITEGSREYKIGIINKEKGFPEEKELFFDLDDIAATLWRTLEYESRHECAKELEAIIRKNIAVNDPLQDTATQGYIQYRSSDAPHEQARSAVDLLQIRKALHILGVDEVHVLQTYTLQPEVRPAPVHIKKSQTEINAARHAKKVIVPLDDALRQLQNIGIIGREDALFDMAFATDGIPPEGDPAIYEDVLLAFIAAHKQ